MPLVGIAFAPAMLIFTSPRRQRSRGAREGENPGGRRLELTGPGNPRPRRFMAATIRGKAFPRGRKSDMILLGKETGIGSLAGWQEN